MVAHLNAFLTGDAGQLFGFGQVATDTLAKPTMLLRSRFSGSRQADNHHMELRLQRRRDEETLSVLYQAIRRLTALAHSTLPQEARESTACDYYIDAKDDADFALMVRERVPATLDEALRLALQLETREKDSRRSRRKKDGKYANVRGVSLPEDDGICRDAKREQLCQRMDELMLG